MTCRGQAYDNASIKSGFDYGAQRRIKEINSKAVYVLCGNHSLNLAGIHAGGSSELSDIFLLLFHINVILFIRQASTACRAFQKVSKPVEIHLLQWHSSVISIHNTHCEQRS